MKNPAVVSQRLFDHGFEFLFIALFERWRDLLRRQEPLAKIGLIHGSGPFLVSVFVIRVWHSEDGICRRRPAHW